MLNNNNDSVENIKKAFFNKLWKQIENKLFNFQALNKEDKDFLNSISPDLEQKLSDYCMEYGRPTAFYRMKYECLEEKLNSEISVNLFKDDRYLELEALVAETEAKYNKLLASNSEVLKMNNDLILENSQLIDELEIAEEKIVILETDNSKLSEALNRNNSLYERLESKLDDLTNENKHLRNTNNKLFYARTQKEKGEAVGKSQSWTSNKLALKHKPTKELRLKLASTRIKEYLAPFGGAFENDFVSIYEGDLFTPLPNKTKIINNILNNYPNAEVSFRLICKKYNLDGTQTTDVLNYFKKLQFKAS